MIVKCIEEKNLGKVWNYIKSKRMVNISGIYPSKEVWSKFYWNLFNNFKRNETSLPKILNIKVIPLLDEVISVEELRDVLNK